MFTLSGFADEISPRLGEQIAELKKLGLKHLELRSIGGKNVSEFTDDEAHHFKKAFNENGLKVSAIGSPIGKIQVTEPLEPHLEKYQRILKMAEIFQTPYIRIFSFYIPPGRHAHYRKEILSRMAVLIEGAKGGFKLQLENEEGLYAESPEHTLDLLATLNHPQLRLTFDFSNFALLGYDTMKAWQSLAPYTTYFHIKDAIYSQKKIVPAGEGEGHIAEILEQAYQKGFSGFASLEPHLEEARKDGGFSGESNFAGAHRALVGLLQSINAKYN